MRRFPLVATLLVVLLASPAAARASDQIVVLQDDTTPVAAETAALEQEHDFDADQRYDDVLRGFTADLTREQIADLERDPAVEAVVADRPVRAAAAVPATSWLSVQPGVRRVGSLATGQVHEAATGAVAVVDTGVDLDHPDLNAVSGWDCISNDPVADDGNGHGTHVAGVIGARNNGFGVSGVAPGTRIVAFRVLDNSGSGTLSSVVCGLEKVRELAPTLGITVVNLSLGGGASDSTCTNDPEHQALCKLAQAGIVPVVAAGNEGDDVAAVPSDDDTCPAGMATCRATPAVYPEVLTVAAMTETDGLPGALGSTCGGLRDGAAATSYSNFATRDADRAHLVAAPGTCIRSTWKGGVYTTQSGTSMATPHVAALVALCDGEAGAAGPCAALSTPQVIQRMRLVGDAAGFTGIDGRDYGPLARFSDAVVNVDAPTTPTFEQNADHVGTAPPAAPA
ncbi:MAG TPA: S8 family serine peptidase, partial [Solirubrobacteraceae bacterium]|nr:S8 family serine peptidase [Solirubrobacteraceae bacterium]